MDSLEILDDEDENPSRTLRERKNHQKSALRLRNKLEASNSKFLADFDPEKSKREKRKLTRRSYSTGVSNKTMYDENGLFRENCIDLCDCLDVECPGCHFPCSSCRSTKCGPCCRVSRKWSYEQIEHDGKDLVIRNPFLKTQINSK